MMSVFDNGLINADNCKLLDTHVHSLDLPMYWYLVRRLHLGLSSMRHEAKCNYFFSVVDNLLACTDLFSFTAPFPAIISMLSRLSSKKIQVTFELALGRKFSGKQ